MHDLAKPLLGRRLTRGQDCILVAFEPATSVGLRFFATEQELSELLDRKVDLNTPGFLGKYILDEVLAQAEVQYGPS